LIHSEQNFYLLHIQSTHRGQISDRSEKIEQKKK